MNTELPQDEEKNEQPVEEQVTEEQVTETVHETVEEVVETVAAEEPAAVEATPESEEQPAAPQLTLGNEAEAGESETESEEEAEPKVYVEPTIRGRIDKFGTAMGTGRRKTSVARVRIKEGNGDFVINGRPFKEYFCLERDQKMVLAPLNAVGELGKVDIWVRVHGGGITGQTGAVVLGIARALQVRNPTTNHPILAEGGFLTRDSRMVERKKYGLAKARKSFQFSKR